MELDDVRHIAQLARLALKEDELAEMQRELGAILEIMSALDSVSLEGVEPTFSAGVLESPLRADVPTEGAQRAEVLAAAPHTREEAFAVPKVMDK